MMHLKITLMAALAGLAFSAPTDNSARGITLKASRPGSPIDKQPVTASENLLWIGSQTATYCPWPGPMCDRYTNTTTVISCRPDTGAPGACDMTVDAPGGQRLYVHANSGTFGYSLPHSSQLPPDAMIGGFKYLQNNTDGSSEFGFMDLSTGNATMLLACATGVGCNAHTGKGCAPWRVQTTLGSLPGMDMTGCLEFHALTEPSNEVAWEYT